MTPLVFEEGTLVGWGSNFVDGNIKKYRLRVKVRKTERRPRRLADKIKVMLCAIRKRL